MFSKRYTSPLEQQNPACASWPAEGSLQTIPTPSQNSWTHCLYDLQILPFSCQLPIHCYSKIVHGRFAISYPFNLCCAQIASPCHSVPRSGDNSTATEADPPGRQRCCPTLSKPHPRGFPYLPGTPSNSTSCSPAILNPANANKQQTKPFSKINGYLAGRKLTFVATPLQFLFVFIQWGKEGGDHWQSHPLTFHALPKPPNWHNLLILHIS